MCGRYKIFIGIDPDDDERRFGVSMQDIAPRLLDNPNVRPTQDILTIGNVGGRRTAEALHWGIKPHWYKKPGGIINARGEKLDSGFWKGLMKRNRVLIPATSFYEWKAPESGVGKKTPFEIAPTETPFAFAGLTMEFEQEREKEPESIRGAVIITTEPNETVAPIHNRMPVILPTTAYDTWIDEDVDQDELLSLIEPWSGPMKTEALPIGSI